MPRPGAQVLISSRLSGLGATRMSTKPAAASQASIRSAGAAPATQPQTSAGSAASSAGSGRGAHDVGNGEPTAGFEHAKRLAEHLFLVGDEVDHAIRDHDVGGVVGDRQMLEFAEAELDVGGADLGRVLARLGQHLVGHVDADDPARVTDLPRRQKTVEAGAAAEIDDGLARLHRGDRLRVAAAEPEIGAFGNRRQLGLRVAHLQRFVLGTRSKARSRTMPPVRSIPRGRQPPRCCRSGRAPFP